MHFDKKAVGTDIFSVIQNLFNSHWYGPLWYVRDLMVVMMLYPIYGWLFRIKSSLPIWITVTVLFYLWKPIDCSVLSSECLVFFVLGGLIGKHPEMLSVRMRLAPTLAISAIWFAACFTGFMTFNEWIHKLLRYDRHSSVLATAEPYTGNVAAENAASFDFLISHLCDAFLSYEIIQTRHRTHLLWQRYHRNDHIHITANYDFVLNNTYRTRLD